MVFYRSSSILKQRNSRYFQKLDFLNHFSHVCINENVGTNKTVEKIASQFRIIFFKISFTRKQSLPTCQEISTRLVQFSDNYAIIKCVQILVHGSVPI